MKIDIPDVKENILLKDYTTFKIGGPAKFLFIAKSTEDIINAIGVAKKSGIPFYLLGSGANVLVSDKGYDGLVIVTKNDAVTIEGDTVYAEAGASIGKLVLTTVNAGLAGIECWAGIPGTVGGSIFGNMGLPAAERGEMSDWIVTVTVLRDGKKIALTNEDCGFSYRHSNFKKGDDVILSATFELEKVNNIDEIKESMKAYQKKKLGEQPLELPSSGCTFKNPQGEKAGRLIDEVGLKGKKIGNAQVSEKHANFINNLGGAIAEEIIMLISLIKQKVRDEKHIQLEEEINYVGF